jgi:hypothetical protein
MANLIIAKTPDIENIIAEDLRAYFADDVHFDELFPKSDNLKVSTDHPFVSLLQQNVTEGEVYNLTGFPSVTVIDMNWEKLVETPTHPQVVQVKRGIVDEIERMGRNAFIMSKQTLAALKAAFATTDTLKGEGFQTFRRTHIAVEVWATNNLIKGKIFDLVGLYLMNQRRYDLHTNYGIIIEEGSITGERSGIYNFDFGSTLYGAMIRFPAGYDVCYYVVKDFTIGADVVVIDDQLI